MMEEIYYVVYGETIIIVLLLIVIFFMIINQKRKVNKDLKFMVNDIRNALREEHKQNIQNLKKTSQLFKDLDHFVAEIPDYIKNK